jgi:predicted aspartyl protease
MNDLDCRIAVTSRRALLLGSIATIAAAPLPTDTAVSIDVTDGRCVVPMLLDGRLARMVVDTGAERTVMTSTAAARLGLRRDLWVDTPMVGAGGLVETHPNVDVGSATLGGAALFQNLPGRALSLSVTNQPLGDADGLLGADLLRHHTLDLDMQKARLVLWPAGEAVPAGHSMPLWPWARGLLLAPLRVDGQELTALVDTGASATLVNARGLYKLGITSARAAQDPAVTTAGLGGSFQAHMHRFAALQLGPLTLPDPLLLAASVPEAAFDVILGMDILGRQRLLLSYASLKLGFKTT